METPVHKSTVLYKNAWLYFLLVFVITLAAFFPSYLQRLSHTDSAHHFHGITATLWLVMLVVQPLLYRTRLMKWHRLLGKISFILAPMVVISAFNMITAMLLAKENYPPLIAYQLAFIDFFTLALFIYFYVQAIVNRKNIQLHSRFLVCTVLGPLIPTLTRFFFIFLPFVDSFPKSLNLSYVVVEVILLLLIRDDKRQGAIHKPYLIALSLFVIQHVLMNFVSGWVWWRGLMDALIN
jgi:hypothetical protein